MRVAVPRRPLCALLLLGLLALSAMGGEPEVQYVRQESQEGGYAIDLPLDWDVKTGLRGLDCVAFGQRQADSAYLENISIAVLTAKEAKSPAEAAAAFVASLKARSDKFAMLSEGKASLSGCEGVRLEYLYELGGAKLKGRTLFLAKGGGPRIWSVSLSGSLQDFGRRKPLFDAVEASFKTL